MSTADRPPVTTPAHGSVIAGVGTALGRHRYPQEEITEAFGALVVPDPERRGLLERLHAAAGVSTRHLALALEDYAGARRVHRRERRVHRGGCRSRARRPYARRWRRPACGRPTSTW